MDIELHPRVVEVEVKQPGAKAFIYSNGFAIDGERILTCAHGIEDAKEIRIRFLEVDSEKRVDVKVVWNGFTQPSKSDVAVLRVVDPSKVPESVRGGIRPWLSLREITDNEKWSSRGVMRASLAQGPAGQIKADVDDFGGEAFASTKQGSVTLTVSSRPKDPRGWHGASGSPVTKGLELLAVVRSYEDAWDGSRLRPSGNSTTPENVGCRLAAMPFG